MIINPIVANTLNAVMCGLMSFGLLMTPQKFMQGGAYQAPWFKDLPEERDNKLYYVGQFMAFVMLGGCVVPTIMYPHSQFLCYQMAVVHSVSLVHTLVFMCSNAYKNARPTESKSLGQWYFMSVLSLLFLVLTILASVHHNDNVVDSKKTVLDKWIANTVMLVFSSVFGVLFISAPRLLFSFFWDDETLPDNAEEVLGFKLIDMTDHEKWWARCAGTAILSLNLGVLIDMNIHQPVYT